jgi:hypothetical protein
LRESLNLTEKPSGRSMTVFRWYLHIYSLDRCAEIRKNIFNFALHREPDDDAPICYPKG